MQRPFLRRIAFPPNSGKKPRTAPGNALSGPSVPESSPQLRPVFAHAPDSAFPAQIPRLHSVRMPARLLRADSAFVSRPRFRVPVQVPHPDSAPASRRTFSLPAQGPHSATSFKRRPSESIPHSDALPGATAPFPWLPSHRPFRPFFKKKKPPRKGALFLNENQFSHLPFT